MAGGVNVGRICGNTTDDGGVFIVCGDYREVMAGLLKEIIIFATVKLFTHGHLGQEETLRRHGENQGQGHEAGMDCAALPSMEHMHCQFLYVSL